MLRRPGPPHAGDGTSKDRSCRDRAIGWTDQLDEPPTLQPGERRHCSPFPCEPPYTHCPVSSPSMEVLSPIQFPTLPHPAAPRRTAGLPSLGMTSSGIVPHGGSPASPPTRLQHSSSQVIADGLITVPTVLSPQPTPPVGRFQHLAVPFCFPDIPVSFFFSLVSSARSPPPRAMQLRSPMRLLLGHPISLECTATVTVSEGRHAHFHLRPFLCADFQTQVSTCFPVTSSQL